MKDLKSAFDARQGAYFNRSSAIFAVRQRPGADLIISFLNYFKFKNNIGTIIANIRIFDNDGNLVFSSHEPIVKNLYEYSVKALLGAETFDGGLEIEFISPENLRFPFPAVLGYYTAGDNYSVVHSAGRIKASSEGYTPFLSEETNFTCKYSVKNGKKQIGPFVHLFNGAGKQQRDYSLRLRNKQGVIIASKELSFKFDPFASRVIEITDEFEPTLFEEGFFCSITAMNDDLFPRFVCGNIHYENDFLEVTHSYPLIQNPDYCESTEEKPLASLLPLLNHPKLSLSGIIFPTNIASTLTGKVLSKKFSDKKLIATGATKQLVTGINGGEIINCPDDTEFMLVQLDSKNAKVPSRINISYRYKVKGYTGSFSTDIATGAKANVYPQKFHHWGGGVISSEYHPVVLIRNNSHTPEKTQNANFTLAVYVGEQIFNHSFSIEAESATHINIKGIVPASAYGKEPLIIHWLLKSDQPVGETFWVSYTDSGSICGEHGF